MDAREVFAGPFDEFVVRRKAVVSTLRKSGDAAAAKSVAAWRKPTRGAWLVNLASAHAADEVGEVLDLGESLAEAHRTGDPGRLRELSALRGRVVAALARRAEQLGRERGYEAPEAVRAEVAETFTAGLADPEVAAAIRAGTLSRTVRAAGFGPADLFAPLAEVIPLRRPAAAQDDQTDPAPASTPPPAPSASTAQSARAVRLAELADRLEAAEAAHQRAEGLAEDARRAAVDAGERARAAERVRRAAQDEVEELRTALGAAQERLDAAAGTHAEQCREQQDLDDARERAEADEDAARAELDALRQEVARAVGLSSGRS